MKQFYEGKLEGKSRGQIIDPNDPNNIEIMAGRKTGQVTYVEADIDVGVKVFCKEQTRAEAEMTKWMANAEKDNNFRIAELKLQQMELRGGKKELLLDHSDQVAVELLAGKQDKLSGVLQERLGGKGPKKNG